MKAGDTADPPPASNKDGTTKERSTGSSKKTPKSKAAPVNETPKETSESKGDIVEQASTNTFYCFTCIKKY